MGAKLGQHFLKNQEKIKKIVSALDIHDGETIIEIGPGHGELTGELESRIQNLESRIIAIEKDKTLSAELQKRFKDDKKIKIIEGDVLKIIPNFSRFYSLDSSSYKLVGNIQDISNKTGGVNRVFMPAHGSFSVKMRQYYLTI